MMNLEKEGGLRIRNNALRKSSRPGRPLISVITVCLNSSKHLEQTIQSVLNQSYENIEYLIIDGGSTDGTLDIIKRYEDKIDYWISEPDKGLYDAMNKGIELSSGDLIGFINSDDYYFPDSIRHAIESWNSGGDRPDVLFGNIELMDPVKTQMRWSISTKNKLPRLLFENVIYHPSSFVKKSVFQKHGKFDLKFKIYADYDFFLRLYVGKNKFQHVDQILAVQRLGGLSCQRETYRPIEYFLIQNKNRIFLPHRLWNILIFVKMWLFEIFMSFLNFLNFWKNNGRKMVSRKE